MRALSAPPWWLSIGLAAAAFSCAVPEPARRVRAGVAHACDLGDGVIRCWGDDRSGQLGRGAVSEAPGAPEAIEVPPTVALDAGGATTCVVTESGVLLCFGANRHGQLGDGLREARPTPFEVPGLPPVVDVSVGFEHVCAREAGGDVWCWGWNGSGQVVAGGPLDVETPTRIEGVPPARAVVAGYSDTCLITEDGRALCWGALFDGTAEVARDADAIAIGVDHVCVARPSELRCFGAAPGGARPPLPPEGAAFALEGVASAAGAIDHLCVAGADGAVWCLGKNERGQIGDGTMGFRDAPAPVRGLDGPASDVTVGHEHTCATAGARTFCWGANDRGQLGDVGAPGSLDPVAIPGG